jgi:hypothetical protein
MTDQGESKMKKPIEKSIIQLKNTTLTGARSQLKNQIKGVGE